MNLVIAGIILTLLGVIITLLAWLLPRRTKKRKKTKGLRAKLRKKYGIVITILGIVFTILAWFLPFPTRLSEGQIDDIARAVAQKIGQEPYLDGLPKASPPVFDPFAKGLDFMAQSKWDEAIAEFKESMKEAKGSQIVALYNLIGICYYTPGKHDSAMFANNKSLELARELGDKGGQGAALGNIGVIYSVGGLVDTALEFYQDALKIAQEIGDKQNEAGQLVNLGNSYSDSRVRWTLP